MLYRKQKVHRDVDEAEAQVQEVWQAGVLIERTMIDEWEDDQAKVTTSCELRLSHGECSNLKRDVNNNMDFC
jgi:hypothetical protein